MRLALRVDLSPMTYAVGDHMHEHLLTRHAARGTVRKRKVDPVRQLVAIYSPQVSGEDTHKSQEICFAEAFAS
jgi:hypothetical protein